jgi:medium-chain acyl-[acyl-carrier-protein] hydrolase
VSAMNTAKGRPSADDLWFLRPLRRDDAALRLYCLPYAGGTPNAFRSWSRGLPDSVEVVGIRLPGRDSRLRERAFDSWPRLLDAVEEVLRPHLDRPFMFFGHSFGARVVFELTRRLEAHGLPLPRRLFISGCRAPHVPPPDPDLHIVPRDEFFERVRRMKGTPAEVLQNRPLMQMLEPTLRADMGLHNEPWDTSPQPVRVPLAALSGTGDEIDPPETMRDWGRYTSAQFAFHPFSGDHFFLHAQEQEVLDTISRYITGAGGDARGAPDSR